MKKYLPTNIAALITKYIKKLGYFWLRVGEVILKAIKTLVTKFLKIIKGSTGFLLLHLSRLKSALFKNKGFIFGFLFCFFLLFIPYVISSWIKELPSPSMLDNVQKLGSTKIYDRNGILLYEIYVDKRYEDVSLEQIPLSFIQATVSVEDSLFYVHNGLRVDSIFRAFKKTIIDNDRQGGSTITQQLVKNVLLTPELTLSRKIKEAILSLLVEAKYSKEEILEMYLNSISYGGNAWGAQSAAQKYFGKNVWELNLSECSMLAGLPSAPSLYSPFGDVNAAKTRQKYVLDRMVSLGYITDQEAQSAYEEELSFVKQQDYVGAPHFVNYVRNELEKLYGKRFVEQGGLRITTTLDYELQKKLEGIVYEEVQKGSIFNFSNGAAVVLDVKNSEILSYIGSYDYNAPDWGAFDVATALRQPGSSIKAVTYSLAFTSGLTPATYVEDSPVTYRTEGSELYTPVNYDGKYHGTVSLRTALANSYNIPAVKIAKQLGPDNIVTLGREMGLKNWATDGSYGLSVTLGGKEVRLLDLTNVYATLARGGAQTEPAYILSIKDGRGYEIYSKNKIYPKQAVSEEVSYLIWNILSDNNARMPAFGVQNQLHIPGYTIAVKTGTTDQIKDNWTFGYTPSYVAGVWVGNNNNLPMNKYMASGVTGAAPIWNKIFSILLAGKTDEIMAMPSGVFIKKDEACGRSEVFIKGSRIPSSLCPAKKDDGKKKRD